MWPSFLLFFSLFVPAGGIVWPAAGVETFSIGGPAILLATVSFKQFQLEHILLRPDAYIGSTEKHTQSLWVYEDAAMVDRPVSYVPRLYKIFDETLVTAAADNKQRDPRMDAPRVEIYGDGVPVEMHPGLIFGHLLTSCNYDDIRKKTAGCRTGFGAKLTNIFPTEFVIETADGKRQKQVFSNNMAGKTQPVTSKCKESENWTELTFKPGLAKFKMDHLENDVVALMKKRVVDLAGCLGKTVKVDKENHPIKSFADYCSLYLDSANKNRGEPQPNFFEKVNACWEVCVSLSEGQFQKASFGSKCQVSEDFFEKVATKSEVVDSLFSWAEFKKTDGKNSEGRIADDANSAGKRPKSSQCTLILTEGDSAKTLALAGTAVVGSDNFGVLPLRGKLLNVGEASHEQIMNNADIRYIKKFMGLKHGQEHNSADVKDLRYGHLMIMTVQDHNSSHIKGLLINFIHSFWPTLLKVPSFLVEFFTPIIKGLGTITAKEGQEYYRALEKHKKDFVWGDDQDGEAIELAFSKKKIEARKDWLRQFEPGTHLDHTDTLITYSDFVNKELVLFSMADLQRSVPSMVDDLRAGQRKILFSSFEKIFITEKKVVQLAGSVSELSAYHHGEAILGCTITGMAQDFFGINLLQPNGEFGTTNQGGKDDASSRLSPITWFLFPKDDDGLLAYLNEDGQPTWYMPTIPTVLVKGLDGALSDEILSVNKVMLKH